MYTVDPEQINQVEDVSEFLLTKEERRSLTCQWISGLAIGLVFTCVPVAIARPPSKVMGVKIPAVPIQRTLQGGCFSIAVLSMGISLRGINKLLRCAPYVKTVSVMNAQRFSDSYGIAMKAYQDADERAWLPYLHQRPQQQYLPDTTVETRVEALPPPAKGGEDPIGLIAALLRLGINAKWVGEVQGASFRRCRVKLNQTDKPQKIAAVKSLAEDLAAELGLEYTPFISRDGGNIAIDIPRPDRQTLLFSNFIKFNPQPTEPIQIAVGVNLDGQLIYADLSDSDTCHFLVGGTTGSGKTEFLKAAIASLIWRYSPNQIQIIIVDPKRTKYNDFAGLPWLYCPIVKDVEGAIILMAKIVAEMENRYKLFEQHRCENLDQYLKKTGKILPRIIVVYDEFADFMGDKEDKAEIELSAKRLGQKAREAGIHLILATQRPDKDVVTPILRSNLPGRIALRVKSEGDSNIILGEGESAHHLLGKGDLLYQTSGGTVRLQSLFLDDISCRKPDVRGEEKNDRPHTSLTPPVHDPHISTQIPHTRTSLQHTGFTDSAHPYIRTLEEAILSVEAWLDKPHTNRTPLFIGRTRDEILLLFKALVYHKAGKIKTIEYGWGIGRSGSSQKYKDAEAMYLALLAGTSGEKEYIEFLKSLPTIEFPETRLLPATGGVYFVFDGEHNLYYIGSSDNILLRWNSTRYPHKRLPQVEALAEQEKEVKIGWILTTNYLNLEAELVAKYKPLWNGTY